MSTPRIELTQRIVHELLDYFPFTGELRWRKRERGWFKSDRHWRAWNAKFAGKPAFTADNGGGYLAGSILGTGYKAHRVIWFWMTGRWPEPEVDHENRKPWDNRWTNLHEASHQENMRNKLMRRDNTSGHVGVRQLPSGRWCTAIRVRGKGIYLGSCDTEDEAIAMRKRAERKYKFSSGHGRVQIKQRRH